MRRCTALLVVALFGAALSPTVAHACDMAEKLRLGEEQKKLAARNAWAGVERSYEGLVETKCELGYDQHFLGSESARVLGKTWERYVRLEKALGFEENQELKDQMASIEADYGRIEIRGDPRRRPTFSRAEMPFAPDQRKAIEWAETVIANTGSFYGMLPAGDYQVNELAVAVEAGNEDFQLVAVGKGAKRAGPSEGGDDSGGREDPGAIRYANLVATVGPSIIATTVGGESTLADGGSQFVPSPITASGFSAQVGGEIGLTYAEPALGVATVVGYSGGYGTDTLHNLHVWAAGVMRPGELRVALGPQYVVMAGRGTGITEEAASERNVANAENFQFGGAAWGPGLQTSVGYGLLDFDTLRGVVELGGSWHSDGARSYFGAGLRVGIVPTVPRFKG